MTTQTTTPSRFISPAHLLREMRGRIWATPIPQFVCRRDARRKRALGIDTWFLPARTSTDRRSSARGTGRTHAQEFATAISGEFPGCGPAWPELRRLHPHDETRTSAGHRSCCHAARQGLHLQGFVTGNIASRRSCMWMGPGNACPDCGRIPRR